MSYTEHPLFFAHKELVSYHESAHAVAAIKLGIGVEKVAMFPGLQEDGTIADGITTYAGDFRDLSRKDAIICFLAGPLAERRIGASDWLKTSPTDFRRIDNILRGSRLDIKHIIAETERLVGLWWQQIELLQAELFHRRVMHEAEIIEAMKSWREIAEMRGIN